MHPISLLVTVLAMLRHPCTRNRATAALLLSRVAQHTALSAEERETCLNLADELGCDALHAYGSAATR
jgi:hypothetical protein